LNIFNKCNLYCLSGGDIFDDSGIFSSPAILAAFHLRSPAIILNVPSPTLETTMGCIIPFSLIDCASSFNDPSLKPVLG